MRETHYIGFWGSLIMATLQNMMDASILFIGGFLLVALYSLLQFQKESRKHRIILDSIVKSMTLGDVEVILKKKNDDNV